jgi:hypothetical protein
LAERTLDRQWRYLRAWLMKRLRYLFSASSSIGLIHYRPAAGVSAAAVVFVETAAAPEPDMSLLFGEGDGT